MIWPAAHLTMTFIGLLTGAAFKIWEISKHCNFPAFINFILSLSSLLWRPPSFIWGEGRGRGRGRRGWAKKWGTFIPVYSWHTLSKRARNTTTAKASTLCVYLFTQIDIIIAINCNSLKQFDLQLALQEWNHLKQAYNILFEETKIAQYSKNLN